MIYTRKTTHEIFNLLVAFGDIFKPTDLSVANNSNAFILINENDDFLLWIKQIS